MSLQPQTAAEVQEAVRTHERLRLAGGATKPGLSAPPTGVEALDLSALAGVVEYEPGEYVFTARAATPVAEVVDMLAAHGQYLPFDPLWVDRGATLAGVLAANTAGPGRYRYGGVRDFIIGVRFIAGNGSLVRGGGKVVKNAAGFDFPKLMVGSLGRLGALTEVSFKVFPAPAAYATLSAHFPDLAAALEALAQLTTSQFDLEAVDLDPGTDEQEPVLWLRIGGPADVLRERLERMQQFLAGHALAFAVLEDDAERSYWRAQRELSWAPSDRLLVKAPLTPACIPGLEARLPQGTLRRYSVGGNLAWVAWPAEITAIDSELRALGLAGMVLNAAGSEPLVGARTGDNFYQRIKASIDPTNRFI